MNRWLLGSLAVLLILLTGCMHKEKKSSEMYNQIEEIGYIQSQSQYAYEEGQADEFYPAEPAPEGNYMMRSGAGGGGRGIASAKKADKKGQEIQAQKQRPQSVHYNGYASLRVSRSDEVADDLSTLAQEVGGHVEELNPRHVTIRVPVETFREVFAQVLEMGDVLDKSISATDISESLTSVSLRLKTSQATRDRLVKLLAKAEDENEKLELIRQIQRLTEEIDRLSGQSHTLHILASMSRITVELVPREALSRRSSGEDIAELSWIHTLSPFHSVVSKLADRLELETPEGFVELSPKDQFIVESADGARLWTGRLENQPRGDTDFWLSAIQERLAGEFGTAEVVEMGSYKVLRLVDREVDSYTYLIGVRAHGKYLDLVEVYYPTSSQEERHGQAIESIIGGGAS